MILNLTIYDSPKMNFYSNYDLYPVSYTPLQTIKLREFL